MKAKVIIATALIAALAGIIYLYVTTTPRTPVPDPVPSGVIVFE